MSKTPESRSKPGQDTSHRGGWFRVNGRGSWHTEAHREYGVLWSVCGVRAVLAQAEARTELGGEDARCTKCSSRKA